MSLSLWAFACTAVAVSVLYVWSKCAAGAATPVIRGDVLLVFAHPDDEAMFFAPLLNTLRRLNIRFHFLCLSSGNAAGLGRIREKELDASGKFYGAASVRVIDDQAMQDGMNVDWDPAVVARYVRQALDICGTIRTVITFDERGVSGHPNHIAVFNGVRHLKATSPPGILYLGLKSGSFISKYSGLLSLLPFVVGWRTPSKEPKNFTCIISPEDALSSFKGMQRHASQFVWFRYLFVWFSSFGVLNEFLSL
ncbi:N-acetylglucosaminylphosphatidylinositoldeacetylase, putative [Bodo saltans]|uniref:N-acetylglucosaminylphosphatidylinositol deacetylase n=1 Tax=Bodo saltans TaxID=75058 RepID=A0A0S4JQJ0_BODSA|nr:N-acetylglucosaminylphosphatidylinositoldeacetylase, putative [Bodo saltans]|eukprot:CUG93790.1 N-acetylglucosaminylphosphatidylinositoldeacetylase, putative [Bodo saltans]